MWLWAPRKGGLGAAHLIFAHNVIQGGDRAVSINGPLTDTSWDGNFIWQTSAGEIPASGILFEDPLLERTQDGVYRPRSSSPLMQIATKAFPTFGFVADIREQASQLEAPIDLSPYITPTQHPLQLTDARPMAR